MLGFRVGIYSVVFFGEVSKLIFILIMLEVVGVIDSFYVS